MFQPSKGRCTPALGRNITENTGRFCDRSMGRIAERFSAVKVAAADGLTPKQRVHRYIVGVVLRERRRVGLAELQSFVSVSNTSGDS
jgi:hypothetical protein